MTHTSSLPTSVTYDATLERLAELRRVAERRHSASARRRPRPSWPTRAVGAVRESVATALPSRRGHGQAAACPSC